MNEYLVDETQTTTGSDYVESQLKVCFGCSMKRRERQCDAGRTTADRADATNAAPLSNSEIRHIASAVAVFGNIVKRDSRSQTSQ